MLDRHGTLAVGMNGMRRVTRDRTSGVARNFIWRVYVLTSHCNFKTCVNVPHVNKTVTDFGGIYTDIPPPPVATPLACVNVPHVNKTVTDFGGIYTDIPPPPVATPMVLKGPLIRDGSSDLEHRPSMK